MLAIYFGYDEDAILSVDTFFNNTYEDEWMDDPFVQRMIKAVDASDVESQHCIMSPVLGQIPPERLSGGVKALICLYMLDDFYTDLIVCGGNCEPFVPEIARQKDIKCSLSGYDILFQGLQQPVRCLNDGSIFTNLDQVFNEVCLEGTLDDTASEAFILR